MCHIVVGFIMIRTIRFLIQQIQTSGNFNEIEKKEMEEILTSMPRHFYIGRSRLLMAWGVVETFKKRLLRRARIIIVMN